MILSLKNKIVGFVFAGLFLCSNVDYAQVAYNPDLMIDDPIAAVLDSLHSLNMFENGYAKIIYPKGNKFNFPHDSVPKYDEAIYEQRLKKIDAASPFDLQYNTVVKGYIEMYTTRKRELVARMMALSQLYFPMFEEQLDKYNLPLELKYLAICESALNPVAKSRAGAMGLWQFMYPTGKMYGLRVSSYVDERCDPYKSTIAACEYFKYLYGLFGDWQMVLAAYNGGPGTVNKAIRRSGGKKTYWEIRPYLPKETQGYVPAFIAVNYVMSYTAEHNLYSAIPKKTFIQVDTVEIKKQLSFSQIAKVLDLTVEEIQYLNPVYKKGVIPVMQGEKSFLTLPTSKIGAFIANEEKIYDYLKLDSLHSKTVLAAQETTKIHTVKSGERLSTIASRYGCTVAELKQWNGITGNTVPTGKKLTIYIFSKKPTAPSNTTAPISGSGKTQYYIVKKGDTLYKIALQYKTTVDELKRLNGFGTKYSLMPGQKIKIKG